MSVTSTTPPADLPPVPLVTIQTHLIIWMATSGPTHKVGHHHPLVIGLVAMHIVYQVSKLTSIVTVHIYTDGGVIRHLFIYFHYTWFYLHGYC